MFVPEYIYATHVCMPKEVRRGIGSPGPRIPDVHLHASVQNGTCILWKSDEMFLTPEPLSVLSLSPWNSVTYS